MIIDQTVGRTTPLFVCLSRAWP